jgi:hypothetical protein
VVLGLAFAGTAFAVTWRLQASSAASSNESSGKADYAVVKQPSRRPPVALEKIPIVPQAGASKHRLVPVTSGHSRLKELILSGSPGAQDSARNLHTQLKRFIGMQLQRCWGEPSSEPFYAEVSTSVQLVGAELVLHDTRVDRLVGQPADSRAFLRCATEHLAHARKLSNGHRLLALTGPIDGLEEFIYRSPEAGACAASAKLE